ncbi:hypothetical protein ENBRE01_1534 [Enteropsectra breve]|nr:hypothetical protein ENBRE01_1534 [Enteropsectra breve]
MSCTPKMAIMDYLIGLVIAVIVVSVISYIDRFFLKRRYKSASYYLRIAASFIFGNKEIKEWLRANDFPEGTKAHALKALLKIVDDGVEYKNLSKSEKNSIRNCDFNFLNINVDYADEAVMNIKFMNLLNLLEREYSSRYDSPFGSLLVKYDVTRCCPITKKTELISEESIFLETHLSPSGIDTKGVVDFKTSLVSEGLFCPSCNTLDHNEKRTVTLVSASKYLIWRIEAREDFNGKLIQFKEKYYLQNDAGENHQSSEYEVISILYIKDMSIRHFTMHYVENNGLPMVFNDLTISGVYYVMMKKKSN